MGISSAFMKLDFDAAKTSSPDSSLTHHLHVEYIFILFDAYNLQIPIDWLGESDTMLTVYSSSDWDDLRCKIWKTFLTKTITI
jgi:hypothetical protein